jgi:hypothetical protein
MDPFSNFNDDSRTVTLRSLTNPSVAVTFNAISPKKSKFSPDDKLFTALDFIFRLVPQEFNSINTHTQPQEGDINISIDDDDEVRPYEDTINESGQPVSKSAGIKGLSISKAPKELEMVKPDSNTGFISRNNGENDEDYLLRCANALSLPNELIGPNGLVADTEDELPKLFNSFIRHHSGPDNQHKAERTFARYLAGKSNRFTNPNLEMIGNHPRPAKTPEGCTSRTPEGHQMMIDLHWEYDDERIFDMFCGLSEGVSAKIVFDYFPHRCGSWWNLPGEGKYDDFLKNPVPYMWGFTQVFQQLKPKYKNTFIQALNFLAQNENNQG